MTALEQHHCLQAIDLQAKFIVMRNNARRLRAKDSSMRREAKVVKLSINAAKLRRDANPLVEETRGLEIEAKASEAMVATHRATSTELLNKRIPPSSAPGQS